MNFYKASCLCERNDFKIAGPVHRHVMCHCTMCQKFSGTAFGSFITCELSQLKGFNFSDVKKYKSSEFANRYFCFECGSSIAFEYLAHQDKLYICSGIIKDLELKPEKQFFVKDACSWFPINHGILELETH